MLHNAIVMFFNEDLPQMMARKNENNMKSGDGQKSFLDMLSASPSN